MYLSSATDRHAQCTVAASKDKVEQNAVNV